MPINLPNGLIAPEPGDSESLACDQIIAIFRAVDALQTQIVEPDDPIVIPCVDIPTIDFSVVGDPLCGTFEVTSEIPLGFDASKSAITFFNGNGEQVFLCYRIFNGNLIIESNSTEPLTVVYA